MFIPMITSNPAGTTTPATDMPPTMQVPTTSELPTIKLGDIATIEQIGKAESISRMNGQEAIVVQVVKSQDANTVEVANAVKKQMKQFEKENDGVTILTSLDQGEPIEKSVETMFSKALFGALFAVVIILLFLRNFKSTIFSIFFHSNVHSHCIHSIETTGHY